MKSLRAELALAGVTFIWGTTFIVVKNALVDVSPVLFIALRFILAAIVLAAIYWKSLRRAAILPGIGVGCLLFAAFVLQTKGLELTTPSKSAFLTGLCTPLVPFFGSAVYRIRPRVFEVAGVLIATVGMGLMTLPAGSFGISPGDLLTVLCAATFALHIVAMNHFSRSMGFETIATVQVVTAAVLGSCSFWFIEPVHFHAGPAVAAAVLVTGLLATALAFTVMAWAQQYTSATRSALIFALEPIVAWGASYVVVGERLSARGTVGALVILTGVLLVEFRSGVKSPS